MAQRDNTQAMSVLRAAVFLVPTILAVGLLVGGGWNIDHPWGVALVSMGFFGLFAVGVGKWQESSALGIYAFCLIISVGLVWIGLVLDDTTLRYITITGGIVGMLVAGLGTTISLQLNRLLGDDGGMIDAQVLQLKRIQVILDKIYVNSLITDDARRVLNRDVEMKMLQQRIDELVGKGNHDAGLDLCEEIEKVYGTNVEADAFRHRILRSRQERHQAEIHGAMEQFDQLLRMRDWAHAHQEAARIKRLFPDSDMLSELNKRIHLARDEHKQELLGQFEMAAKRDDVDTAMNLLKELDRYLSRDEAEEFSSQASAIVERHRDNLSTRFKMAVNDHQWQEAISIGDLICNEFPNSKMAKEVNSMVDVLRTRVSEVAGAPQSPSE